MTRYLSVGIDVGTHTTRVAVSELAALGELPRIIGTGSSDTSGLRHGYIVNITEAVRSIKEAVVRAEKSANVKIKKAVVSIGGISLESSSTVGEAIISKVDGEITELDVDKAFQASREKIPNLANRKIVHRIPLGYKLDGKMVFGRPIGMKGLRLEAQVLYITTIAQHLDDLIRALELAGIEVEDVAASPIAASLVTLTKTQRTAGCVLVNIGGETTSIAVFENDLPLMVIVLPIASTDITNDIALGIRRPIEEAEDLKRGIISNSDISKKKLDEIISARLLEIFEMVQMHLKKIGRNELLPAGIVLTGGGSGIATAEDLARATLRLPAQIGMPKLSQSKNLSSRQAGGSGTSTTKDDEREQVRLNAQSADPSWAVAYGLCILGANDSYASDFSPSTSTEKINSLMKQLMLWAKQFLP